jgi:UDP-glucose/iron transport system ATP-binding protein
MNTSTTSEALFADGLTVSSGGVRLLSGINLSLNCGEMVALSGPSGCGKTTLLRTLAGLINPQEGQVLLRGESPSAHGWPNYRRRVIYVQQRPALLNMSVYDNLARPFSYRHVKGKFPQERANQLLDRLLIGKERGGQDTVSLSEGQRQRVALIRALLLQPEVLLLDEPTSALDETSTGEVEALISDEVKQRSLAVLIATHNRSQAREWCDRALELEPYMEKQT